MPKTTIHSGICSFVTVVEAVPAEDGQRVNLTITSGCPAVQKLAADLPQVDALQEISYRGEGPRTLALAAQKLRHTACPVPAGIIKAVEVAAGLALPAAAHIEFAD